MTPRFLPLAILLPLVGMLLFVGRQEWGLRTGKEVTLKVAAYDPRDLLSGHYLQYSVSYFADPVRSPCPEVTDNHALTCVCLNVANAHEPAVASWSGKCSQRPNDCVDFVRGTCEYNRFVSGIERYYIPESYSSVLTQVPEGSQIRVRLGEGGNALVSEFLVGEMPLDEYVRSQRGR